MSEKVKISLSTLKEQVEKGMKKKELAEFYSLPETQVTKLLKQAGLTIRKFKTPKFELVMDEESTVESASESASTKDVVEDKENSSIVEEVVTTESIEEVIPEVEDVKEAPTAWELSDDSAKTSEETDIFAEERVSSSEDDSLKSLLES